MKNKSLEGVWTAVTTPFLVDGSIDWPAFDCSIERQIEGRVSGVVVCGTTGESPTLSFDEKLALVKRASEVAKARIRVMFGSGSNDTSASVALTKAGAEAGADSFLVVTPPYNKPNTAGLVAHFTAVSKAAGGRSICLYHVPGRTGQRLSIEQFKAICAVEGVDCVKEASGDIALFTKCVRELPGKVILSGDDLTYLASLSVGGKGCISVASNIIPKQLVDLTQDFFAGRLEKAVQSNLDLFALFEDLFIETNPVPVKFLQSHLGHCADVFRLPLAPACEDTRRRISQTYSKTKAKF